MTKAKAAVVSPSASRKDMKDGNRRPSQNTVVSAANSLTTGNPVLGRLSVQNSLNSQFTEASNTSFTELVKITEEGHPFIDINTLVYKPNPHQQKHHSKQDEHKKEKFMWYVPDFTFIVFNLTSLCVSTYFCIIGTTTLTWKASTGMFSIPPCTELVDEGSDIKTIAEQQESFYYLPCKRFTDDPHGDFSSGKGYDFKIANNFPILRTKLTDVHYFGLVLICLELANLINVMVGINACLQGYKAILIQHIAVDGVIVLGEFVICAVVAFTSICDVRDLNAVREIMKNFVHWYGTTIQTTEDEADKDKVFNTELDALQIGLGCCGVDGWADYLAARFPESDWFLSRSELDEAEMVIPNSCCRQWWIRNIYCSHGVHLWANPLAGKELATRFQERIVQDGCMYKLEKFCLNIRAWMGYYGFVATMVHFFFILFEAIAALVLIKNINNLIREKKKLMRKEEMLNEEDGSDLDFSTGKSDPSASSKDGKKSRWSTVPPPTEDEIMLIKQRSNFNKLMSRVKFGRVGQWMGDAQRLVTEGHEGQEEAITAEEKKQREKHLLHSKQKKDADERQKGEKAGKKGNVKAKVQSGTRAGVKKKGDKPEAAPEPEVAPEPEIVEPEPFKLTKETEDEIDAIAAKYDKPKKKSVVIASSSEAKVKTKNKNKKKATAKKKSLEKPNEETEKPVEEPPVELEDEPPPLTDEGESHAEISEDDRKKKLRKRRRRRMRKTKSEKPPWFKNW